MVNDDSCTVYASNKTEKHRSDLVLAADDPGRKLGLLGEGRGGCTVYYHQRCISIHFKLLHQDAKVQITSALFLLRGIRTMSEGY